jgi:acyl carrier protein
MTLEELVGAVLGIPAAAVSDETAPHNTGEWTSMAQVQLVQAVEDVYGVSLSMAGMKAMTSVGATRAVLAAEGVHPDRPSGATAAPAGPG